jgi:hypothetical protein
MDEATPNPVSDEGSHSASPEHQSVSGTYSGERSSSRLILRLDLKEQNPHSLYQPLNLVSGDFYRDVGGGEWDYRYSFIVEHPYVTWRSGEAAIVGRMAFYRNLELAPDSHDVLTRQVLKVSVPLGSSREPPAPATVQIIHWGTYTTTYRCEKTSPFFRIIDLEIDRITGTELPSSFDTDSLSQRPPDLPSMELDIPRAFGRAGIGMRIISDKEIFDPAEAGTDLKWDEDELHNAMEHHFSQWIDEPQWRLYLLIASHYRLYPEYLVTGIMYDSHYRSPSDPFPRQGASAFYTSMKSPRLWGNLSRTMFNRNFLRTCVHELGHTLNLLHSFDKDRPDSLSWMNYPWRYPHGYNLPPGWNGTSEFWQNCRFEFDVQELRHLRHHALMEVIPGGAAFGALGHDVSAPIPVSPRLQTSAPLALFVRTRPERYLFQFAEPVTVEVKLKNQTQRPVVVPDMLNPEFGLLEIYTQDPKGRVRLYRPLFRLCGEAKTQELPAGESLYGSIFVAYGADGFYFEEPGEYQLWAVFGAGGVRLRSNALRIRVAFPQTPDDEEMALRTFGRDQGHVLYMCGAAHLKTGTDHLREVADRFPATNLARYIHYCLGSCRAREFKDVVNGKIQPAALEEAAQHLAVASTLLSDTQESGLDNITHGHAVDLLSDVYSEMDQPEQAAPVLSRTARYFARMEVKQSVIDGLEARLKAIRTG